MLDSARYGVLYSTLKKYISTLSEHSSFYDRAESRDSIADVVKEEAPLFLFLASKANAEEEAQEILSKFKEVFLVDSWEESGGHDYSDKSFEELNDDVNYLRVCVKNICELDLDNLDVQTLKKEEGPIKNYNSSKYQTIPDSLAAFRHALNEDISFDPSVSKEIGDFLLRSHAYERLNKDINDGSIYIYTSKPRINAIIKYILIGLSVLGACVSAFLLIFSFMKLEKISSNGGKDLSYFSLITAFVGTFYFSRSIFSLCKNMQNDNFKYSFGRRDFVQSNVFLIIVFITLMLRKTEDNFLYTFNYTDVGHILVLAFLLISIIFTTIVAVSYFCLQPKKNTQLVESILEQHMSDLSKGASV